MIKVNKRKWGARPVQIDVVSFAEAYENAMEIPNGVWGPDGNDDPAKFIAQGNLIQTDRPRLRSVGSRRVGQHSGGSGEYGPCDSHAWSPAPGKDLCPPHREQWFARQAKKHDVRCPGCSEQMVIVFAFKRATYKCPSFPNCLFTHGAHQDTLAPLGTPADAETRKARIRAHEAFDQIWKSGLMSRKDAYASLARAWRKKSVHIADMLVYQCEDVIRWANSVMEEHRMKGQSQ